MKKIDNNLYLDMNDAIRSGLGLSEEYIRKEKSRGAKWGMFINDPDDKRKILIEYETLADKKKSLVQKYFGNPYEHLAKDPIKKMVVRDLKAFAFYLSYEYSDNLKLPVDDKNNVVEKYTVAASWLNMLVLAEEKKKEIKKELGIGFADFWIYVSELIELNSINLPSNIIRLRQKVDEYKEKGYACLIHKKFGNKCAAKISTELAESTLLNLISNGHQFDDVFVCYQYNNWAIKNNHEPVTPSTVGNYRRKNLALVIASREGSSAYNERFIREVKGLLPQAPLRLVEHDDNNLDFLFADETKYAFNKYVAVVVIDSRTKLVLGYSYAHGRNPEIWQVHHAYLSAMYYIRKLTGAWHLPFELKADKWAKTSLTPFYNKIAKFIPPSHGNKHRGYIEQFFSSPLWKRSQKLVSQNNWSGNNMTAKTRGVNEDLLRQDAKQRPLIGQQAEQQIENFFHLLRNMPDMSRNNMMAKSKEEQFREEWEKLSDDQKRPISDEQFLLTFGIRHQPKHTTGICITNRGVEPQIKNIKYSYDLPETWMYNKLVGERVEVYYDPYDMSRILVVGEKHRFVARSAELVPRAISDHYEGSRTYLNALLNEKKEQVAEVGEATERRRLVASNHINPEAMLQGGVLVKEEKNQAEQGMLEDKFSDDYEKYLDNNNDFSDFFNQAV
jgi:hypothetical protein